MAGDIRIEENILRVRVKKGTRVGGKEGIIFKLI